MRSKITILQKAEKAPHLHAYCVAFLVWFFVQTGPAIFAQEFVIQSKQIAQNYLSRLPDNTKLYVWPTKERFYEVVGDNSGFVHEVIENYNKSYQPYLKMKFYPRFPVISVNIYDGIEDNFLDRFVEESNLTGSFKKKINQLDMGYKPCVFTTYIAREKWVSSGVIFLDQSRIQQAGEQAACIKAGLDYLNGFPADLQFEYEQLPSAQIREMILSAILGCSHAGDSSDAFIERSKDEYTALPNIACVKNRLSE